MVLYPLVWYCLHRWVLHSNWMFKVPFLASTWKRIHYDHHMNPNDLSVLFGAPYTTIPAVLAPTLPLGYLAFGWLTMGQLLSIPLVLLGIYWIRKSKASPILMPVKPGAAQ